MKRSVYLLPFYLVLILMTLGCTSTNVLRLEPIGATNSTVINGRTVVKETQDSIDVVASFVGLYQDYAVFDLEVFNNTNHDLIISPQDFYLKPYTQNREPFIRNDQEYPGFFAIDPTHELVKLDKLMAKEEKKIKTAKTINTILAVAGAVTLVAGATKSNSHRDWVSTRNTMALGEGMLRLGLAKGAIDRSNYYSQMDRYMNEKEVWQHQTFLKNVLAPKTSIRGDIFIRYTPTAPLMQMTYPVNDRNIIIWFEKRE
ncbi:MAG: hypothetical protein ACOVQ4_22125 [Flectobacillus sp.]|uniref:hypothetical protein n=1 Tax=Flectobacillus sp. TaxID=50419 RepID=UPI003B9BCB73